MMEAIIIENLGNVGYDGPLTDNGRLAKALQEGLTSVDFTQLVAWLSLELKSFCDLDEHINPIASADDVQNFLMESSGFLRELGCPYSDLVEGSYNERLKTKASRMALLTYLISELQAARMIEANNPEKPAVAPPQPVTLSPHNDLKNMLLVLRFTKPPDNITAATLFAKVETKLDEVLKMAHPDLVSKPIFNTPLNPDKWKVLAKEQQNLHNEYKIRREMLLNRLHVTIQSFEWADRLKNKQDDMTRAFRERRKQMPKDPAIDLADLLAARLDLAVLEKTSNASVRKNTQSDVNRVLIGKVPDRGGRPSETAAPPKEMPSWQTRSNDGPRGGGGGGYRGGRGGDRGGGRGGRGYNPQQQQQYNESRSGHYQNQGGRGGGGSRVQGGWNNQGTDAERAFNNGGGRGQRGGYGGRGRGRGQF